MKRKIIIVSGTRADYGLLKKLTLQLQADNQFETYLVATGAHLSEKHGKTINLIKQDNIQNILEVDLKIESDQPLDISHALSVGVGGFAEVYKKTKPELIVVLGDRYELWAACMPATIFNIPIVHIHGGESTQGAIDEVIRHSITKMSHLHLCSHPDYKKRIIQMGEQPERVFVVGAIGLDRIKEMKFLSREELSKDLKISFGKKNILCTFHSVTIDPTESSAEINSLKNAIGKIIQTEDVKVFITFSNADTYSSGIQDKWNELLAEYPDKVNGFVNLGDQRYLSLMKEVELILGNSSSGILEAPFLNKAVVNVGLRQRGRLYSEHVIQSEGSENAIYKAIVLALSDEFQSKLKTIKSIYGEGNSVDLVFNILKEVDFKNSVLKVFNDEP